MEGSSFFVARPQPVVSTPGHEAPRGASSQGGLLAVKATQLEPRQRFFGSRCTVRPSRPSPGMDRIDVREGVVQPGHRRHPNAVAPVGLCPTVVGCLALLFYGAGRAAEVDALVSTPLATGASGPGIRTFAEQVRSFFGRGPRPIVRRLAAVGRKRQTGPLMKRPGARVRFRPSFADGLRGSRGDALNKCAAPGRVGNDRFSPDVRSGLVLRDEYPRDRSPACMQWQAP